MRGRVLWIVVISGLWALADTAWAQDAARTEADLRQLRGEIERIRGQVAKDAAERDRLTRDLRAAEKSAGSARSTLERLRTERRTREQRRATWLRKSVSVKRNSRVSASCLLPRPVPPIWSVVKSRCGFCSIRKIRRVLRVSSAITATLVERVQGSLLRSKRTFVRSRCSSRNSKPNRNDSPA